MTENDPIVISADIGNNTVRRILINDSSAVEILSYDVYQNMSHRDKDLKPAKHIYRFDNNSIHVRGGITLPVTMGEERHTLTFFANFVVVDQPMAYNAIIWKAYDETETNGHCRLLHNGQILVSNRNMLHQGGPAKGERVPSQGDRAHPEGSRSHCCYGDQRC